MNRRPAARPRDALEALVTDIARRFADGVLEAVCAASLAELVEDRRSVTPARPVRVAPRPASRKRRARRAPVQTNAAAIAHAVRAAGAAGIQAAGLREVLGFTKPVFTYAMRQAVKTGLVRQQGAKRGTRYFAA